MIRIPYTSRLTSMNQTDQINQIDQTDEICQMWRPDPLTPMETRPFDPDPLTPYLTDFPFAWPLFLLFNFIHYWAVNCTTALFSLGSNDKTLTLVLISLILISVPSPGINISP